MDGRIHSIESFGTVDGPGTRFVVFTAGCNLRCKYCHNPDTWKIGNSRVMSVADIIEQYSKVKSFVPGGITVTGGDPLLQIDFLIELFTECKRIGVHTCLDTSGGVFNRDNARFMAKMDSLMQVCDLVLLDIKHINDVEHKKLTGVTNVNILDYARYLSEINKDVWIRHVIIDTITLNDKYLFELGLFLKTLTNIKGLEILPYHTMAISKYEELKMPYPLEGIRPSNKQDVIRARAIVEYAMKGE